MYRTANVRHGLTNSSQKVPSKQSIPPQLKLEKGYTSLRSPSYRYPQITDHSDQQQKTYGSRHPEEQPHSGRNIA